MSAQLTRAGCIEAALHLTKGIMAGPLDAAKAQVYATLATMPLCSKPTPWTSDKTHRCILFEGHSDYCESAS
jgi:hypothetical protein